MQRVKIKLSYLIILVMLISFQTGIGARAAFEEFKADFENGSMDGLVITEASGPAAAVNTDKELEITYPANMKNNQTVKTSKLWDYLAFKADFLITDLEKNNELKKRIIFTTGQGDSSYKLSYSSEYARWYFSKNNTKLMEKGYAIQPNQWYTMKIVHNKGSYVVLIGKRDENLTEIINLSGDELTAEKAPVTVMVSHLAENMPEAKVKFDNIIVSDPTIEAKPQTQAAAPAAQPANPVAEEKDQPLDNMTITVGTTPRQTFNAFGFGMNNPGLHEDPKAQEELYKLVYDDLGTKSMRIWFSVDKFVLSPGEYNLDAFKTKYGIGNNGVIENAKAHGVTEFLLAPSGLPKWMVGEVTSDISGKVHKSGLLPEYAEEYGETIARAVFELKTKENVKITATGIYNELDGKFWEKETYEALKACRKKLDSYGLKDIKIICPELANNDSRATSHFNYAVADADAWNSMFAFSTHSYNMAPNKAIADLLVANPKPFWQTESSTVGPEDAGNYNNAATTGSRMLNDFNHMVTDWFYFIGYLSNDPKDNGTRLIITNPKLKGSEAYIITEKYYYVKHILKAFDIGTQMRLCTSDKEGEMQFTYGRKGKIYAASGVNPDGTWTIGIINDTNTEFTNQQLSNPNSFYQQNANRPSQPFDVTINMRGLTKSGEQEFKLVRTGPGGVRLKEDGTVKLIDGKATIRVEPYELITLRSVNKIEETIPEGGQEEAAENADGDLTLPPKPDDMTEDQYQLWIQGSAVPGYDTSKLPAIGVAVQKQTEVRAKERLVGAISLFIDKPFAYANNSKVDIDKTGGTSPVVISGRTLVPVRFIAENLNAKVSWEDETSTVTIIKDDKTIRMVIGDDKMEVNGETVLLDVSAQTINDRTMLPLRALTEILGKYVFWDDRGLIIISGKENIFDAGTEMPMIDYTAGLFN